MKPELMDILACPVCKDPLKLDIVEEKDGEAENVIITILSMMVFPTSCRRTVKARKSQGL
jgi:uncharacterized protein YbaR (Trm112 family)